MLTTTTAATNQSTVTLSNDSDQLQLQQQLHPSPMRPDSLLRLWRYINHLLTYLLTMNNCYTHGALFHSGKCSWLHTL